MPSLASSLISEMVKSGTGPGLGSDIDHHILLTASSSEETKNPPLPQILPVNMLAAVIPKVDHIVVPSTPDLSPYLMPSIATTIASINGKSRSGITIPIPEDNSEAGKLSSEQNLDKKNAGAASEWPEDCTVKSEIRLDGTTADDEEVMTANPESLRNTKPREDVGGGDKTTSRNGFTPNEIFSKIPIWVRPSTSTFMSCPSSHMDYNQKDGLGGSPGTGSATPELTKSNSTRFYSPLEATSANSTGVSTPAFVCPPTPGYEFRPSIDNTSSFYPSPGTSRCVSLVESERHTPELSALSADADAHGLNRTPRPSDMIINSPGGSLFKFPWVSRTISKSPEPITNDAAFTRGSSLAHLKKIQKRDRDLQRGAGTNTERSQDIFPNQHGEVCEDIYLEDRAKSIIEIPGGLPNAPMDKASWYYDNLEDREVFNNLMTPAPKKREKITTWVRSTTRVSSLTMRQNKVKDPRIWGSPQGRSFTSSKRNIHSNYGKTEKKFSLKNSISLGERMWERSSIWDKTQEKLRKATGSEGLSNLTSDIETLDETEARNSRLKNRRPRAMIRSRSMTLRRSFTNSIAKLRGKVSFNESSRGTVVPPPPRGKQANKDGFYPGRCNEENLFTQSPETLGGRNKFGISGSDVSSIIFRPSLPKDMLEHQCSTELIKNISPGDEDTVTRNEIAEACIESSSYPGVHSHRIPDDQSVSDKPGLESMVEESAMTSRPWSTLYDDCVALPFGGDAKGSGDAESDSDADTQSSGPFRVDDRNTEEIWRDARESLEITA
ncbi:hypothetical protein DFP73DRAFT_636080 [Morchella snyderi]|nr:hypothetical protein DFP73DRAFT_636080 [Morchella snyderi]